LSIVDHHLHAVLTPLDARLRLAGTAEFSGWDERIHAQRIKNLWIMLQRILPEQYPQHRLAQAESWCGFRPMAADGLPYIGASAVQGLYVNAGQGHLGWTQSLGSGSLLAAMIAGEKTPIDPLPFRVSR
jgi:D-amino-acid dehydrogenase